MAKINNTTSYPEATAPLSGDSILIGSLASGVTNNFQMSDIAAYVSGVVGIPTLEQVCTSGNTTTTSVQINNAGGLSILTGPLTSNGSTFLLGSSTVINGTVDINNTADISDTLTLSKPTGTGLDVTASMSVGGNLTAGTSTVGQTAVTADGFQTNNASFTATASAVQTSFGTTFTTFDATIVDATITTCKITGSAPASASAAGVTGSIVTDADYIYVCTATNTWKRVAIATW